MRITYKIEDTGSRIEVRKYTKKDKYIIVYICDSHEQARDEITRLKLRSN